MGALSLKGARITDFQTGHGKIAVQIEEAARECCGAAFVDSKQGWCFVLIAEGY